MEKHLYRSRNHRIIAGVAGGLADYLEIDPLIIRLIFLLLLIGNGIGLIIYIIAWVVIPENPALSDEAAKAPGETFKGQHKAEEQVREAAQEVEGKIKDAMHKHRYRGHNSFMGLLLIVLGIIFLLQNLFPTIFAIANLWPIFVILAGLWVIISGSRKE